jgi:hypothetical protein
MEDFASHTLIACFFLVQYLSWRRRSHDHAKVVLELLRVIVIDDMVLQATRLSHLILNNTEQLIRTLVILLAFRTATYRYTKLPAGTLCCTQDNHTHAHPIGTPRSIRLCRDLRLHILTATSACD